MKQNKISKKSGVTPFHFQTLYRILCIQISSNLKLNKNLNPNFKKMKKAFH